MITLSITLSSKFANSLAQRARVAKQSLEEHAESIVTTALLDKRPPAPLTPRQAEAYQFISSYIGDKGFAPSFSEIGKDLGLRSTSGVHRLLVGLVERGAVRYSPKVARSLEIIGRLG